MSVLSPAETGTLIDHLVADLNAARFATVLGTRFEKSPERYTASPDFRTQLAATFAAAESENWIKPLLAALSLMLGDDVQAGKCAGDLLYLHAGGIGLQTLLPQSDVYEARLMAKKLLLVTGQVCLLEIDGNPAGTGLLVGTDQVLTAYHVISKLLSDGAMAPGSAMRLRCRFDFAIQENPDGSHTALSGSYFEVSPQWLGPHSAQHPKELEHLPPPGDVPIDTLDYALITLDEKVGETLNADALPRGWTPLCRPPKSLRRFAWIRVIQHPQGVALKGAEGRVTEILPNGARLRYYVSTSQASSGSPCWNFDFNLVAIHNLGGLATPTGLENQGIPIAPIIDHIQKNFPGYIVQAAAAGALPVVPTAAVAVAAEKPVWWVGAGYPVLNRVDFQHALQEMLPQGAAQVLLVRGSRYSGRSFSLKIAQQLLGPLGHTIVTLSAISLNDASPELFVAEIQSMLGLPEVPLPVGADLSTRTSLAQRHLLTAFLGDLRKICQSDSEKDRLLWIFIDGLDQAVLQKETYELLAALAQRVAEVPALRLALIGYEQELPSDVDATLASETIAPVTVRDVEKFIRHVCERAARAMPDDQRKALAEAVIATAPTDTVTRLKMIAQKVQQIGRKLQEKEADNA
ncbi:MAG: trypsin-like peptidase domain-containing protein [Candidatus Accumulibacter sp.]|jgi:hypothetical protein|nr:trypsin-like peptidase domain-containing protein [Accumulibacter sp.]